MPRRGRKPSLKRQGLASPFSTGSPRAGRRPRSRSNEPTTAPPGMVRLQRVMADAGVAARRACEQLIEDGEVSVNGEIARTLPVFVNPAVDRIVVSGRELPRVKNTDARTGSSKHVYVILNKPARVVTAVSDDLGRGTVLDIVQYPGTVRLYPVGRLDYEATGLVLLTNDGQLANQLTHPRFGVDRAFDVVVKGRLEIDFVADLQKGLVLKAQRAAHEAGKRGSGTITLAIVARKDADLRAGEQAKTLLRVTVKPGLPVKIADILGEAGVKVSRVTQVGLGPLKLIDCKPGQWRELERHEITALRKVGTPAERTAKPEDVRIRQLPPNNRGPRRRPPSRSQRPIDE